VRLRQCPNVRRLVRHAEPMRKASVTDFVRVSPGLHEHGPANIQCSRRAARCLSARGGFGIVRGDYQRHSE
jgi:hypothetical protein